MSYLCYHCFRQYQTDGVCPYCGYDGSDAEKKFPLALKPGSILNGRYTVGRVLGQGGFGITYIAQDYQSKERVAIKEYLPGEFANRTQDNSIQAFSDNQRENYEYGKEQFLSEARTLATFNGDEHIVRIYSYFEENNTAYFVMEYVDGYALDKYMARKGGRLSVGEANRLLLPLMESLSAVHARGIIHRDIAPDNIIVTNDGSAKLIDFGAARYSTGEKSRSLDVVLKHGFAPTEQYMRRGRQGPYTDVYALAATYYYAITGKVLPDAVERMQEDTMFIPSSLGVKISREEEDVLLKALEVSAADRFQNMADFHREMEAANSGTTETIQSESKTEVNQHGQTEQEAIQEAELFEKRAREAREKAARLEHERKEREAQEAAERKAREAREEAERREQERRAEEARKNAERLELERRKQEAERIRHEQQEQKAREEAARKERQRLEREAKAGRKTEQKRPKRSVKAIPILLLLAVAVAAALMLPGKLKTPALKESDHTETPNIAEATAQPLPEAQPELTVTDAEPEDEAGLPETPEPNLQVETETTPDAEETAAAVTEPTLPVENAAFEEQEETLQQADPAEEVMETEPTVEPEPVENFHAGEETEEPETEMPEAESEPEDQNDAVSETVGSETDMSTPAFDQDMDGYFSALRTAGNTVLLGRWEQDNDLDNGPEPIEWIILDVKGGSSLLLSRYVLDSMPFHETKASIIWQNSGLRKWLNDSFLNTAFGEKELGQISLTSVDNSYTQGNPDWPPVAGATTLDRVFLLSYQEALQYASNRASKATDYAAEKGARVNHTGGVYDGNCPWWLRSAGETYSSAADVRANGMLSYCNDISDFRMGVRPALWVDNTGVRTPGYSVKFGHYEQDDNLDNGPELIEWIVLDEKDGKSLLLSKYALDTLPYYDTRTDVTWTSSNARKWLNQDFLTEAFNSSEIPAIILSTIDNSIASGEPGARSYGGANTTDRIFLLSFDEALQYFFENPDRRSEASAYAVHRGALVNATDNCVSWWTRTPGSYQNRVFSVTSRGTVITPYCDETGIAIRPAIWVDQEKIKTILAKQPVIEPLYQEAKLGNTVTFGHYEQDNNLDNGPEPIEWIVADEQDSRRLLISSRALEYRPYHELHDSITWEGCSLRKWLNDDFLNTAFSHVESEIISVSAIDNGAEQGFDGVKAGGGNNTKDKVFILSYAEAKSFFQFTKEEQCTATEHALHQSVTANDRNDYCWWWTRSPGGTQSTMMVVSGAKHMDKPAQVDMERAVRPAIWIDTASIS